MSEPLFNRVTILGVGLLGGSLGMALKKHKLANEVLGVGRSMPSLEEARRLEAIDQGTTSAADAVAQSDLVVLCTPVRHIIDSLPEMISFARPGCIFTDVGSTKGTIVRVGEEAAAAAGCHFVGSHPMAGSEKSGVRHSRENLYADSTCFVTKTPSTNLQAFAKITHLWHELDARVVIARPERHDQLVASISHLPHVMAVALVRAINEFNEDKNLIKGIIGNGFRDTTRIACGDSRMWEDICTDNHVEINRAQEVMQKSLTELMQACGTGAEGTQLRDLLDEACDYRQFMDNR